MRQETGSTPTRGAAAGDPMILPWAEYVPSPNASGRAGCTVDTVVIHHISLPPGEFDAVHIAEFFLNRLESGAHPYFAGIAHQRVSSHFLVDRVGRVTQFVDTDLKAWHAGESSLAGVSDVNRFSVGIELVGDGDTPYTEEQYRSLLRLLSWIIEVHPGVRPDRIVGHEHVSPGRKTDPGPLFDWERVRRGLRVHNG
jgi:AmpD protein